MHTIICKYRMQFRLLCVCVGALCCLRRYRFKNICARHTHTHTQTIERGFEHRTAATYSEANAEKISTSSEIRERERESKKDQQEQAYNYKKKWHEAKRIFYDKQEIKNLHRTHRKNRERIKFFFSRFSKEKHSFSICLGATQAHWMSALPYIHWNKELWKRWA